MLEAEYGRRAVVITTIVMTAIVLVFAEVLPKTLAIARTDRFALAVAQPIRLIVPLLAPIVSSVQFFVWQVLYVFGVRQHEPDEIVPPHEEIRGTVELHLKEGGVEREHRDMLSGVLDLRELSVTDVMIHRTNMVAIDIDTPPQEIVDAVLASNHTRVPLWRGEQENIIGILAHQGPGERFSCAAAAPSRASTSRRSQTQPWFVPETTTLEEQLAAFRERRTHFALVVDEYGALQGLVTLEDILDEIFGDIPDEHEAPRRPAFAASPTDPSIDGDVAGRDINRELAWSLPEEEATTIAGLVIYEAHTIPEVGQRFAFFGYKFEILRRQRNQITAVRVTPPRQRSVAGKP